MTDLSLPARPSRRILLTGAAAAIAAISAGAVFGRRDRFDGAEISPDAALDAIRTGELTMIDIRRPDEWAATGIAEGAYPLDMRRDDFVDALATLVEGERDRPIALICARGVRSDRMSARLGQAGFERIIDVPEGMLGSSAGPGWVARGLPVVQP
ncbi:rhodanese-like domain-containing protein [Jannaschia sp. 2305UL9-9]|uniref:rhodanese-like domain-containing protein n=1 Tax=Jannaschia sp. 2305UL9-9 TaxID=3121638 RepID=UPI003529106D